MNIKSIERGRAKDIFLARTSDALVEFVEKPLPRMREISIAQNIIEIAEARAREENSRCIQVIKIRLGEFTTIVREALEFAFEIARRETLAENAKRVRDASLRSFRERDAGRALEILRSQTVSAGDMPAGTVHEDSSGIVTLRSRVGGNRVLDMLSGEQLPRIC